MDEAVVDVGAAALRASGQNGQAVERGVPRTVDFMLGTRLRIGEALAVSPEAWTWTPQRSKSGRPVVHKWSVGLLLQPKPKTRKGWRTLPLPPWLMVVPRNRAHLPNEWTVVFPSPLGKLRDCSNTNGDLRAALTPLGHKRVSMTQDTYFGRAEASPEAADVLNRLDEDGS